MAATLLRWIGYIGLFTVVAVPAFFMGWYIALLPCVALGPGVYCNPHGGPGVLLGLALGFASAIVCGSFSVKWLKRQEARRATQLTK